MVVFDGYASCSDKNNIDYKRNYSSICVYWKVEHSLPEFTVSQTESVDHIELEISTPSH